MFVVIGKLSFFSCFSILTQHYLPNFCSRLIFLKKQQWQWVSLSNFQIIWTNFFCLQKHSSAFQSKTKTFLFPFEKKTLHSSFWCKNLFFFFWGKDKLPENPQKASAVKSKKVVYRLPQTSSSSSKGGTWITIFTRPIVRQSTLKSKGLFQQTGVKSPERVFFLLAKSYLMT